MHNETEEMNEYVRLELSRDFMIEFVRKADPNNIAPPAILANFAVQLADALLQRLKMVKTDEHSHNHTDADIAYPAN